MKQRKSKNENFSIIKKLGKKKAFTLIELLLTIFIFSIIMVIVMGVMVNSVVVKKRIQGSAQNLEEARFAMETMAKTIRDSEIISCNDGANVNCDSGTINLIETYDYSQDKCIQYYFYSDAGGNRDFFSRTVNPNVSEDPSSCVFSSGTFVSMIGSNSKIEDVNFEVVKSDATVAGRVTILMEICSKYNGDMNCVAGKSDNFPIQTTVSLRY